MATGSDQSAYLGSSTDSNIVKPAMTHEKVKEVNETRKTRAAHLRAGAKELLAIIDKKITEEDTMTVLHGKAKAHLKNGRSIGEAMSDELIFEAGRIEAFNEIKSLLSKYAGSKK